MDDEEIRANPIFRHHQRNLNEGTFVKNEDGSISTVYTTIMGDGEYEYLIPQVWDVYKAKNAKALSLLTLVIFFIGQLLWITHGYYSGDRAVLTFACITAVLYVFLIYAKIKF